MLLNETAPSLFDGRAEVLSQLLWLDGSLPDDAVARIRGASVDEPTAGSRVLTAESHDVWS